MGRLTGYSLAIRYSSVVLLDVNPHRVAVLPLERQTPRSVDVHAVADGPTLQPMEIEPWHVDVRGQSRLVEYLQADQRATVKVLSYPGASPRLEQFAEPRVPKVLDHQIQVSRITRHIVKFHMTAFA